MSSQWRIINVFVGICFAELAIIANIIQVFMFIIMSTHF